MANTRVVIPFGENALVQIHENSVLLSDRPVQNDLHMAMSAEWLLDVASATVLGPQLHWLEPLNVGSVEEHEPNNRRPPVDLKKKLRKH